MGRINKRKIQLTNARQKRTFKVEELQQAQIQISGSIGVIEVTQDKLRHIRKEMRF
jgi:hypothetical protein